jgi:transposase
MTMNGVWRRCCGIDVHKDTAVVCVLGADGSTDKIIRKTYGTFQGELIRLRVWLKQLRVTHIAMESTGVYWMPVWNVLEDPVFTMLLANPQQVKALRGRKSDKRDAKRIAEFLQDRRLDPSFVPPPEIRELRMLTRHRVSLLEQRNEVHNQIRDLLESSGIKLSSVASDLMGVSGQRILRALAAGEESAERLSWKVRGKLRKKAARVKEAMKAEFSLFRRELLTLHLQHYDFLTAQVGRIEAKIRTHMEPYTPQVALLSTIPGIDYIVSWNLLAELGADMDVFPDAAHCASWAGLCPGSEESGGKRISGRTRKGNRYLRRILTQAAWANSHCKDGYLRAMFHRVKARRGWGRAVVAVAHKLIVIAYHMLKDRLPYRELGGDYFDQKNPERVAKRLIGRLERLGYTFLVPPVAPVAPVVPVAPKLAAAPLVTPDAPAKRKRGRPRKMPAVDLLTPVVSVG